MERMRLALLLFALCLPGLMSAENVLLRKAGNPAVVTFEYITQDEETIMVKLPGRDGVLVYRWSELDQDHAKTNNPRIWEERTLLLRPPEAEVMKKPDDEDPFAAAAKPNSPQDLSKNLLSELNEGLKGLSATLVPVAARESNTDELTFWRAYDELRKLSNRTNAADPEVAKAPEESDEQAGKPAPKNASKSKSAQSSRSAAQSAELSARAAKARADAEKDVRPFSGLGYLKMLADGSKTRTAWAVLRRASEDRRLIVAALRRQDAAAAELSERIQDKAGKSEIAVFRKAVTTLADGLEKVTRESTTMESSLSTDAQAVLVKLPR